MHIPTWSGATLLRVWLGAVVVVVVAQLMSAALYPRRWDFFWILPIAGRGPLAVLRAAASVWFGLWQQRPLEALSLAVVLLASVLTLAWAGLWLVRAGQHAYVTARAV
jgi:hypothetical protein